MMMTFDDLIDFLDSDENEFGLSSVATHGFLTASIVGKPLLNWQNLLFEGQSKQVNSDVLQALTAWRNELLAILQDEKTIPLPFDVEETDYTNIEASELAEWSIGFVDAMYASDDKKDDWFANSETEEDVAMLTLPMVLFSGIDEEDAGMQELLRDPITMQQMAIAIEKNIIELFLLFHTND